MGLYWGPAILGNYLGFSSIRMMGLGFRVTLSGLVYGVSGFGFRSFGIRSGDLLILKILHDLSIRQCHCSQGIRYFGSCRMFRIHRKVYRRFIGLGKNLKL